jgi:hypothetical protein
MVLRKEPGIAPCLSAAYPATANDTIDHGRTEPDCVDGDAAHPAEAPGDLERFAEERFAALGAGERMTWPG